MLQWGQSGAPSSKMRGPREGWQGFPGGLNGKECTCNAGDPGSIPGSGRSPEEGNGNPHQYSRLKNRIDRGARQATVHEVAELDTTGHNN